MIADHHAALLAQCGIPVEVAKAAGVRSVLSESDLPEGCPPYWTVANGYLPGLLVPWRTHDGRVEYRIRPDEANRPTDPPNPPTMVWRVTRDGEIADSNTDAALTELVTIAQRAGGLGVDVETTGFPVGHVHYRLKTVQLGDEHVAFVFDVRDPDPNTRAVIAGLLAAAPRLWAHSATADLVPLVHDGYADESVWDRMYDTVIPAKLADPASTGSDPGLKQLAGVVLGELAVSPQADAERASLFKTNKWRTNTDPDTPPERSGWCQVDPADPVMVRYAASDVLDTVALAQQLPQVPSAVYDRERAVQRVTARVTHRGLRIDGDRVRALLTKYGADRDDALARVRASGVDNPASSRQLAERLTALGVELPRTKPTTRHPYGQPSVTAAVLTKLAAQGVDGTAGELIRAVLAYRDADKLISTFLEPYLSLVEQGDGRVRPTIYTLAADTGRMSSVRPNLQQVPRKGGIRPCITADPGYVLVSADFSGVELRVAAALSGDTNLRAILAEGRDLHAEIAREVFGPEASKEDRSVAKRIVFGRLYGGGIRTLAEQAGVSESVAASAVDVLDALTPGLAAWSRQLREAVKAGATEFPTYSGRVIQLDPAYPHKAPNYAIQGTARELLVDALLRWDATEWGGSVVLPVHDEIIAMVPEQEGPEATAALLECMTTEIKGVTIAAEASAPSPVWSEE